MGTLAAGAKTLHGILNGFPNVIIVQFNSTVVIRGGEVSDGSRLAMYQTVSIANALIRAARCVCMISPCIRFDFMASLHVSASYLYITVNDTYPFWQLLSCYYYTIIVPFFLFCLNALVGALYDVPLIFSCPADHVTGLAIAYTALLGMIEARSVNVKNIHTQGQHYGTVSGRNPPSY